MEELIRNIVEADKKARNNVALKKQEKNSVQDLIQEQKDEIKAKYQDETKRCILEKRAEMDKELAKSIEQEESLFKEALLDLQQKYDTNRETWVERIVEHCLNS